jgi:hypothetical protein
LVIDWLEPYLEDGTGMEIFASKVGILVEMYRVVLCLFLLLPALVRVWFARLLYALASCKSGWSISLMCISKDFHPMAFA